MEYAMLFTVMGTTIIWLAYTRHVLNRKYKQATIVATLLIAEKVGTKVNGRVIKIESVEVENADA